MNYNIAGASIWTPSYLNSALPAIHSPAQAEKATAELAALRLEAANMRQKITTSLTTARVTLATGTPDDISDICRLTESTQQEASHTYKSLGRIIERIADIATTYRRHIKLEREKFNQKPDGIYRAAVTAMHTILSRINWELRTGTKVLLETKADSEELEKVINELQLRQTSD